MREAFLHFIWKSQKFSKANLRTTTKESVEILNPGMHNASSGPDFLNSRICIAGQEWAGNVEIHLNASDWYAHAHENDSNYDNVILHVVWEDDVAVFRKDGSEIPTLALKDYTTTDLLSAYQDLIHGKTYTFINCEKDASDLDSIIWQQWKERLFVERLESKSIFIETLLQKTKNNWEFVLFILLMKTFGLNKNGVAFLAMAEHLGGSVIKKVSQNVFQLESLLFGLAGFLNDNEQLDNYYQELQSEFTFLKRKYKIAEYLGEKPIFFGLRPANFPTIRLSQLANLYGKHPNLFSRLMNSKTLEEFYELLGITASIYWNTHFTFGKESKSQKKTLSKNFIHLIVINAVIPMRFCYDRFLGKEQIPNLMQLIDQLPAEKNSIVERFDKINIPSRSAFESQAAIQLYNTYCKPNRCLQCHIGSNLLNRKH